MVKGFRQIALLTTFSRVFGMLRDMTFAFFFGATGMMDAWVIAFMIPNLARRLFGEGAASSSLIPVYSEQLHKDPKQARKLASTVVTAVFVVLLLIVILGELAIGLYYYFFSTYESTDLKLTLAAIMLPYMILICLVAILAGLLNAHRHFAAPAAAPLVLNIFLISALCFSGFVLKMQPKTQVFFVACVVLIAGLAQLAMQMPALKAKGLYIRPAWQVNSEPFKKIVVLMAPMILGLTATQINTLADVAIATWFSGSAEKGQFLTLLGWQLRYPLWEGAVSQLFYSQRLYQFPLGVLGISLATAIFPVMSSDAARKDFDSLKKTIARGLRAAVFVAIPATAGLLLVARPLVAAIFQRGKFSGADTTLTAHVLSFYALGLCGFFLQQIVTRAFYSLQDSKMPARSALIAVMVNVILNLTLIWFMGAAGLALATVICSYLQVIILLCVLRKHFDETILAGLLSTFFKTLAATAIMSALAAAALKLMSNLPLTAVFDITRLAVIVPLSAGSYFLASKLLKIESISLLTGRGKQP